MGYEEPSNVIETTTECMFVWLDVVLLRKRLLEDNRFLRFFYFARMNDVVKVKELYGDQLLMHGGWDSFGPHNYEDCTEEQVRAEVRRCIDTYGKGGNYALFAVVMGDPEDEKIQKRRFWVDDECHRYRPWQR